MRVATGSSAPINRVQPAQPDTSGSYLAVQATIRIVVVNVLSFLLISIIHIRHEWRNTGFVLCGSTPPKPLLSLLTTASVGGSGGNSSSTPSGTIRK